MDSSAEKVRIVYPSSFIRFPNSKGNHFLSFVVRRSSPTSSLLLFPSLSFPYEYSNFIVILLFWMENQPLIQPYPPSQPYPQQAPIYYPPPVVVTSSSTVIVGSTERRRRGPLFATATATISALLLIVGVVLLIFVQKSGTGCLFDFSEVECSNTVYYTYVMVVAFGLSLCCFCFCLCLTCAYAMQ